MQICAECKREMKCIKMGVNVRYQGSHVYAGDLFECPDCGTKVVNCNSRPYHNTNYDHPENDIYMDDFYDNEVKKVNNLNLRRKT